MKRISVIFSVLSILLITACSHEGRQMKMLADVDSLIMVNADSAKSILLGMDREMVDAPDEVKAYYNLLRVKTDDKTFVEHTSDSLICSVADYYEKVGNRERLPETYYYIGRANVDMKNSEKALFYLQKAIMQDSTFVSPNLRGRAYAQIGYVYHRNCLFEDAKNMHVIAYTYFKESGDTLFMRYCKDEIRTIDSLKMNVKLDSVAIGGTKLKIMRINEKLRGSILKDENTKLQSNYEKSTRWHNVMEIAIAILVVVAAAIGMFYIKRKIGRNAEANNEAVSDIQQPTMTKRKFYDKEINELLIEHIKQNKLLKQTDWKLIEERLLTEFPEFKDKLYSIYHLSETEYHICMLIKLETAPSNIAKLMAMSNSSISQNRLRMQQKVFNGSGTAKDWDNFVLSL